MPLTKQLLAISCLLVILGPSSARSNSDTPPEVTQSSAGNCSPNLVQVQATQSITFNCDLGKPELQRFARKLTELRSSLRFNAEQTAALVNALNELWPSILDQLQLLDGKQDQALTGIAELLQRTLKPEDAPLQIEEGIIARKGQLVSGAALSKCGCWGKFFDDHPYGDSRDNPSCMSGREETVACSTENDTNVCRGFWILISGYSPWMRVCE